MSRHLTHRFWLCALLGFGGALLTLVTRTLEPAALGAPFLATLLLSMVDGWWRAVGVEAPRLSAARVIEGDVLSFDIDLVADAPVPWVELEVQFPATLEPTGPARFVTSLPGPRGDVRRSFQIPIRATRWGAAGPEWAVVTSRDRFGVSEWVARYPLQVPVRIHPPTELLNSLVPLYRERAVTGEHRSRRKGSGSELAEVRPYRYGDPVRMIHPGLSRRRGTPMVIERHPERSSDVVLLIDSAQDLGVDLATTLRWTVTASIVLAERHLRAQDRVGLLDVGWGFRWLPPRLGRRHLHTLVDALLATEVHARNSHETMARLPANLPRSATIVCVSPLISELILSALVDLRNRGHEVLVIKPEVPAPDESVSLLAQRVFRVGNELNHRWLLERGAIVIPWSSGDSLEHLMRRVVRNLGRSRQLA
jgi:uncharacterized protein (DUF58 family)